MSTKMKLMLVDDDTFSSYLSKISIEQTNRISLDKTFENGLDAINFIKDNLDKSDALPDIILLDLFMPVMDGWQFMSEYKSLESKLRKKIVVFIVSSSISPADITRSKSIDSIKDYIIKPITKEKLLDLIKDI